MTESKNESLKLSIYRFNPEVDTAPYMQDYEIVTDTPPEMLLDALILIKSSIDDSLTFRRSCREGVCGSDGMNVNGVNVLACITPISKLKKPIIVKPLPGFPVIRDLSVDMEQFFDHYNDIKPYLIGDEQLDQTQERLQTPNEREKLDGLYECILCGCCTSSCPSYWWNPEKFLGPAAILWMCRFLSDSRDIAKLQRLSELNDLYKLFRCRGIMNCVNVCPKGLNPTQAITKVRKELIKKDV